MLGLALAATMLSGVWLADLPDEVRCEGQYTGHLQGIAGNGVDALYWSFTTVLVKTDLDGKILARIEVPTHHGDLCLAGDRLYVAWSNSFNRPGADSKVYVYDAADLALLEIKSVPEVTYGAGGMAHHDGRFMIIGGLPKGCEENYVYEYDSDLQYVATHVLATGYTPLGIQTACFHDDHWWFGCYGSKGPARKGLLRVDADMALVGMHDNGPSVGLVGWGEGRFLMATHFGEKYHAKVVPMLFNDDQRGLTRAEGGAAVAPAAVYYVSVEGDDANDGLREESAWRTISHAAGVAKAGDTVKIKGGDYGPEHVELRTSGTEAQPIVFEGYDGTPLLDGEDRTGKGISVDSVEYVELRNLAVKNYERGIILMNAEHVTLEGLTATDLGGSGYNGWGIYMGRSHHCVVRNCTVTDARAVNFHLWRSNFNLLEDCTSLGVETDNAVDYYIVIGYSHDNTIMNCTSRNLHLESRAHAGHGIGIKDSIIRGKYSGEHSYNNRIVNCETHGHGEHLYVAHYAHHNEFINCTAYNGELIPYHQWNHGFYVRDGAHNNVFRGCRAFGVRGGVVLKDTSESPDVAVQHDNVFVNCIFDVTDAGMYLTSSSGNSFAHCVITGAKKLFVSKGDIDSNSLTNCIIAGIRSLGSSGPAVTYSDFWDCGFDALPGTGNISADPLFADPAQGDYHLKSRAGRWNSRTENWVGDEVTSPCLDAGDPESDFDLEPAPNGDRANIGAYGNTTEASRSAE